MTDTTTPTATETEANNQHSFLGLYIKKDLKEKIAAAAAKEERSMNKIAIRIFEKHFENA